MYIVFGVECTERHFGGFYGPFATEIEADNRAEELEKSPNNFNQYGYQIETYYVRELIAP